MLFIPAYLTTPMLRAFSSPTEDGSPFLMTLLTINMVSLASFRSEPLLGTDILTPTALGPLQATRYAGGTLTYTAIMVLVNAMSPPEVVRLSFSYRLVRFGRTC
jgi:hypothetical protein